ncbi:hypothetical protein ACH5RR_018543 [Cinchona calisaya]|uniref:Uncharacterized protein n=1 Tax=Cinchona calisaya TaxID=153742 RepID=A0ABD2ZLR2_9GENT
MGSPIEPSSSTSFTSSSFISNGSDGYNTNAASGGTSEARNALQMISLSKLSSNLGQLLPEATCDYSDAEIIVEGISVGVHRCILAGRSKFFQDLFRKEMGYGRKDDKPKYSMEDLLPYGKVGYEAFLIFLGYLYTGKLKPFPVEVSTCVDSICAHDACRPAINFVVELMYASSIFHMPELVSLFQRRLLNFIGKAFIEDVIPILAVAYHCQSSQLLSHCVDRVSRSDIECISLEKELTYEIAENIRSYHLNSRAEEKDYAVLVDHLRDKRIRRIHKALDSDDVELVRLLLTESDITLDEAYALHYAVSYCDPKIVSEVLSLGLADANLRNARGYSVLHIAAIRKEPSIIVSLLTKGACVSETTLDGRTAVSICRRLTRPKDYHAKTNQGQESNKDRICIDVLEREMLSNPMVGDITVCSTIMTDDLQMRLLYLENRVAFAQLFFPAEAKLAMDIANAETTSGFAGLLASRGSSGNLREVDLNETPQVQNRKLLSRIDLLSKTVELGRRYFPHCSQVLDKFMEDDLLDLFHLEKGSLDEQKIKRSRFMELKGEVRRAFNKDKAELRRCGLSPSSSSSSLKEFVNHKARKL